MVHAGDRVRVGADDPEFPGWRWCTGPDGRQGWVPQQLLQLQDSYATVRGDYTTQELSVAAGAEVVVHRVLAGWVWVSVQDGQAGWVPQTCIAGQ